MSDHMVREGQRQMDREANYSDRVEHYMKQHLADVVANPNDHDIDVDLLDNGDFLEFLEEAFKPGGDVPAALAKLARAYTKLAEAAAERLAEEEIRSEDEMRGHDA